MAAGLELMGGDGHPPPDDWVLAAMGGGNAGAADDGDAPADDNAAAAAAAAALLLTVLKAGGPLRVAAATLRLALLHCIGAVQPSTALVGDGSANLTLPRPSRYGMHMRRYHGAPYWGYI